MRKAYWELGLIVIAVAGMHTIRAKRSGFINGKMYPANSSESVLAINGKDSIRSSNTNGYFGMSVKPGMWKVVISDKEQVKNVVRENLSVSEGQNINLGVIRLAE
jgi:hypothetical protein